MVFCHRLPCKQEPLVLGVRMDLAEALVKGEPSQCLTVLGKEPELHSREASGDRDMISAPSLHPQAVPDVEAQCSDSVHKDVVVNSPFLPPPKER